MPKILLTVVCWLAVVLSVQACVVGQEAARDAKEKIEQAEESLKSTTKEIENLNQKLVAEKQASLVKENMLKFEVEESKKTIVDITRKSEEAAQQASPLIREASESQATKSLRAYLKANGNDVSAVAKQPFASLPLSKVEASKAQEILVDAWKASMAKEAEAELKANLIKIDDLEMKLFQRKFGEKPKDGWSLYISMHGGGGTTTQKNNSQWRNQRGLYKLEEGIYVTPRAPTDTWNLWQQAHVDQFFDRLITDLIVSQDVNPNRVYIMGYSAGGDGVYQLGPRLADRLAAAAMMAGHPGDAAAESLRNLPFTIHVGENDRPYKRNEHAAKWKKKLADLHEQDPDGYTNEVQVHKGKGHWMNKEDAVAIPWMAKFSRNQFPKKVVWKQDNVKQKRFYWLAVNEIPKTKPLIVASIEGQKISIEQAEVDAVSILVNDQMLDMDRAISIDWASKSVQSKKVARTIGGLATSLLERGDPGMMFSARIEVQKPEGVVSAADKPAAKPETTKPVTDKPLSRGDRTVSSMAS